ncbi:MAG: iron export ABC transporter permease subunit FetB [Nitrospinae bacterium CG11_big_fil_rev_8_21_14_0_20_56_8]|nr:MAG: iron export ABC transporter permease subunit FetB [Nitrospinae bacterium CG11_big_fil_rev_8_21_14_0_20_56_8]
MNTLSLVFSYGLVVLALLISWWHGLRMEKEMVLSSLRATVQLIVVGFLLEAIFKIESTGYLFLILLFMCGVGGVVSGNRGREVPASHAIAFAGIVAGSSGTFAVLFWAGVIHPEPRYIIPIGGMIIGNSMNTASLTFNRLAAELKHQRGRIETLLALGADAGQASLDAVRQSVKAALIPTFDSMKTVGLVHLPGIMTGYIIAGGSPLTAVKYQLAIMYMLGGAAGLTCLAVALLAYRRCFNSDLQLALRLRA